MDDKSVKKRMKARREKENLSQSEMADRIGMSLRAYNSLETGGTRIFNSKVEKFAEVTGADLEELVFGYNPHESSTELKESFDRLKEMFDRTVSEYEEKLASEREKIRQKDLQISNLTERIKDKEKLIRLLEKQSGNN